MPWPCRCTEQMPIDQLTPETQTAIHDALGDDVEPPRWKRFVGAQIESRVWLEWHRARGTCPYCRPSRKIDSVLRAQVLSRHGQVCGICGDPIARADTMHIDHVVPVVAGGLTNLDNLQPAHAACNLSKGAKT